MRIMKFFSMVMHDQFACKGMRKSLCSNQTCTYKVASGALCRICHQYMTLMIEWSMAQIMREPPL